MSLLKTSSGKWSDGAITTFMSFWRNGRCSVEIAPNIWVSIKGMDARP